MAQTQVTFRQVAGLMIDISIIQSSNEGVSGLIYRCITNNVNAIQPFIKDCEIDINKSREECIRKDPEGRWLTEKRKEEGSDVEVNHIVCYSPEKEKEYEKVLNEINNRTTKVAFSKITPAQADTIILPFNKGSNFKNFFNLMVDLKD